MSNVVAEIERAFGAEPLPHEADLVRFDGFDEPAKEYLRDHLSGKTQDEVLHLLREGAFGNGSTCTEELELAEPAGIRYYLKPFLVDFAESVTLDARALDDETPFFLFAHIRNILERRGSQTFTEPQLQAMASLVAECQQKLQSLGEGIWVADVSEKLHEVSEALKRD
jgi:hypothetical protein